jgi:hypothetical protein
MAWGPAIRRTLGLLRISGVQLYGYFLFCFVPFVIVWLAIERLAFGVTAGMGTFAGVVIELVLFQVCSFVRTGQSLLFTASAAALVGRTFPDVLTPAPRESQFD